MEQMVLDTLYDHGRERHGTLHRRARLYWSQDVPHGRLDAAEMSPKAQLKGVVLCSNKRAATLASRSMRSM